MKKTTQPQNDEAFACPISHEIMLDPVCADDGETYEREEIEKHFKQLKEKNKSITSPLHNIEMDERLVPNRRMLSQIKDYIQQNPQCAENVYFSKNLVINLLAALNHGEKSKITEILRQDKRLLIKPLVDNKQFIHLACEQKDLAILKFVLDELKQAKKLFFDQNELDRLVILCLRSTGQLGVNIILEQCSQSDKNQLKDFIQNKIKQGNEEMITICLKNNLIGIDESLDEEQNTALHLAAEYDQRLIGKLLIESGANIKAENRHGQTAIAIATSKGHQEFSTGVNDWLQRKEYLPLLKKLEELETESKKQQLFMQTATAFFKQHLQPADEYSAAQCVKVHGRLLKLLQDGTVITDYNNSTWLWSSKTKQLAEISGSFIEILDDGNIITQQSNETLFWAAQSKQISSFKGSFNKVLPNGNIITTIILNHNQGYSYSTGLFNVKTGNFNVIPGQFKQVLAADNLITQDNNSTMLWDGKTAKAYALMGNFCQLLNDTSIITSTSDETILWHTKTAERLHTLKGKFYSVLDSKHLIVTTTFENVNIISSKTGHTTASLAGNFERVLPDGSFITNYDGNSQLWDADTNQTHTVQGKFKSMLPSGAMLFSFTSQAESSRIIWDTNTKKTHTLPGKLAAQCEDGTIITSNSGDGKQLNIWQDKNRAVYTVQGVFNGALSNGNIIFSNDSAITCLWNATTQKINEIDGAFHQIIAKGNIFTTLKSEYLNSRYQYKTLFWNLNTGTLIYTLEGNWKEGQANTFVSTEYNNTRHILLFWDVSFEKIYNPNMDKQWNIHKTLSDGSIIGLLGQERTFIWNPTKKEPLLLEGQFKEIHLSGDIITSTNDKTIIWDAENSDQKNYIIPGQFKQLLPNGNIVTSTQERTIIWDFATSKTYKLAGMFLNVLSGGDVVAYSAAENATAFWNAKTKKTYLFRGCFGGMVPDGPFITKAEDFVLIWQPVQKNLTLNVDFSQQELADLQKQAPECKII